MADVSLLRNRDFCPRHHFQYHFIPSDKLLLADSKTMVEQLPSEETPLLSSAGHRDPEAATSAADDDGWKPTWNLRLIQSGRWCFLDGVILRDSTLQNLNMPHYIAFSGALVTWCNVFLAGFDSTVAASTYSIIGSEFGSANNAVWVSTR